MATPQRRRPLPLALDQNFPTPILNAVARYLVDVPPG